PAVCGSFNLIAGAFSQSVLGGRDGQGENAVDVRSDELEIIGDSAPDGDGGTGIESWISNIARKIQVLGERGAAHCNDGECQRDRKFTHFVVLLRKWSSVVFISSCRCRCGR